MVQRPFTAMFSDKAPVNFCNTWLEISAEKWKADHLERCQIIPAVRPEVPSFTTVCCCHAGAGKHRPLSTLSQEKIQTVPHFFLERLYFTVGPEPRKNVAPNSQNTAQKSPKPNTCQKPITKTCRCIKSILSGTETTGFTRRWTAPGEQLLLPCTEPSEQGFPVPRSSLLLHEMLQRHQCLAAGLCPTQTPSAGTRLLRHCTVRIWGQKSFLLLKALSFQHNERELSEQSMPEIKYLLKSIHISSLSILLARYKWKSDNRKKAVLAFYTLTL